MAKDGSDKQRKPPDQAQLELDEIKQFLFDNAPPYDSPIPTIELLQKAQQAFPRHDPRIALKYLLTSRWLTVHGDSKISHHKPNRPKALDIQADWHVQWVSLVNAPAGTIRFGATYFIEKKSRFPHTSIMFGKDKQQELADLRHSFAHLLAAAVLDLYPGTKNTIGPSIDDGFYYDFEFKSPISEDNLPKIEKRMREILKKWKQDGPWFEGREVSAEKAKAFFKGNEYKQELIEEIIQRDEKITLYKTGPCSSPSTHYSQPTTDCFTDLCRGGHAKKSKDMNVDAFKLIKLAGAYWRGDEKNPMLTRIYGTAFKTKEELDEYLSLLEEAKRRDHKKLGPELDLFTFSPLVGPGLPLWTPKGTLLRHLIDDFVWSLRKPHGYQKVEIPHITKKELYETSGHWDKFKDELFRIKTREGHEFAMKPMNCPHHTQIYVRRPWSYKELPQRYANTTTCYRDEQTGELSGLSRVRAFAQDDAHVFCRTDQIKEEFLKIWDIVHTFYHAFGFKLQVRLSLHDPEKPENYLGDDAVWEKAENMLREIAKEKKADYFEGIGEAAFYGPKLDFIAKDAIGRQWQVATIQLDMVMPERFDLTCVNENGEKERIVMIHAAIAGSLERFMSILIEHTAGKLPVWLAPVQVRVLAISEKFQKYAKEVEAKLQENDLRVEVSDPNDTLGKRIRQSKLEKIPYLLVVGEKERSNDSVSIEHYKDGDLGNESVDKLIKRIQKEIQEKKM